VVAATEKAAAGGSETAGMAAHGVKPGGGMTAIRQGWMFAAIAMSACALEVPEPAPEPDEAAPAGTEPKLETDGMQTQGRFLLGRRFDDRGDPERHFAVGLQATGSDGVRYTARLVGSTLRVTSPRGTYEGSDPGMLGLVFPGVDGGSLRLGKPVRLDGGLVGYGIEVQSRPGAGWEDVCEGTTALPVAGTFGRDGLHHDGDAITFGCHISAISKCVRWGYAPTDGPGGPMWEHFQACTRMTRFDICSDGTSHTMDGTLISFRDQIEATPIPAPPEHFSSPTSWPPPPQTFFYEAAWRGGDRPARCLARHRWDHLALGGPCDDELPDPRLHAEALACEDLLDDVDGEDGALIFSASRFGGLAMHRWEINGDLISTIMGHYYAPESGQPMEVPYQGTTIGYHGIDGLLLRTRPDSVDESELTPLFVYRHELPNGTILDRVVATDDEHPTGYQRGDWHGFAFKEPAEDTTPLYLYRNGNQYVTSTLPSLSNHVRGEIVGHVFATPGTSE
jgi:hypothetical protein